jgi:hypothetical protein
LFDEGALLVWWRVLTYKFLMLWLGAFDVTDPGVGFWAAPLLAELASGSLFSLASLEACFISLLLLQFKAA